MKQRSQQQKLEKLINGAVGSEGKANEYIKEMASVRSEIKRLK